MKMTRQTRIALAFLAFATAAGGTAIAGEKTERGGEGPRGHSMMRFGMMDTDDSGDVTLEEFTANFGERFEGADADGDGKMTIEEIAAALERARYLRMAQRVVARYDADGDGALTEDEMNARQEKLFALLDRNSDGKVEEDEMRSSRFMRSGKHHGRW